VPTWTLDFCAKQLSSDHTQLYDMASITLVLAWLLTIGRTLAFKSWAGSNLYYAAGLSVQQQNALFSDLASADVKVLRVWLDGQSESQKGTSINAYPELEDTIGTYDDTVLERYDDLMLNARKHGIKLMISIYSYNSLDANDAYAKQFGFKGFYTKTAAKKAFKKRIRHVLRHVNKNTGKTWAESSEYVFAFEPQNEAMNTLVSQIFRMLRMPNLSQARTNRFSKLTRPGNAKWPRPSRTSFTVARTS
jgi:mannan endo-1,4-beta-mannosidase